MNEDSTGSRSVQENRIFSVDFISLRGSKIVFPEFYHISTVFYPAERQMPTIAELRSEFSLDVNHWLVRKSSIPLAHLSGIFADVIQPLVVLQSTLAFLTIVYKF